MPFYLYVYIWSTTYWKIEHYSRVAKAESVKTELWIKCKDTFPWSLIFICGKSYSIYWKVVQESFVKINYIQPWHICIKINWIILTPPLPHTHTPSVSKTFYTLEKFQCTALNTWNIVAAFREMHVSPTKHSYAWLPRKCDYRTDRQRTKWSLCAAMLRRRHKNVLKNIMFNDETSAFACFITLKNFLFNIHIENPTLKA